MSNRNLHAMSIEQLHGHAQELAAPFGIRMYVCRGGTLAVWFKLRDADDIPAWLRSHVLADSYRHFITYLIDTNTEKDFD